MHTNGSLPLRPLADSSPPVVPVCTECQLLRQDRHLKELQQLQPNGSPSSGQPLSLHEYRTGPLRVSELESGSEPGQVIRGEDKGLEDMVAMTIGRVLDRRTIQAEDLRSTPSTSPMSNAPSGLAAEATCRGRSERGRCFHKPVEARPQKRWQEVCVVGEVGHELKTAAGSLCGNLANY